MLPTLMSDHVATIEWATSATAEDFIKGRYSREHTWRFDGGVAVAASPSPSVVPAPWSSAANVDPEEAYVASISSCHMLTFLYVASKAGVVVASYRDDAIGTMTKVAGGTPWISRVRLMPTIAYGGRQPTPDEVAQLHHAAHDGCFIAASVKTEILVGAT